MAGDLYKKHMIHTQDISSNKYKPNQINKSFSIYISTEFNEIPPKICIFRSNTAINHSLKFNE